MKFEQVKLDRFNFGL